MTLTRMSSWKTDRQMDGWLDNTCFCLFSMTLLVLICHWHWISSFYLDSRITHRQKRSSLLRKGSFPSKLWTTWPTLSSLGKMKHIMNHGATGYADLLLHWDFWSCPVCWQLIPFAPEIPTSHTPSRGCPLGMSYLHGLNSCPKLMLTTTKNCMHPSEHEQAWGGRSVPSGMTMYQPWPPPQVRGDCPTTHSYALFIPTR